MNGAEQKATSDRRVHDHAIIFLARNPINPSAAAMKMPQPSRFELASNPPSAQPQAVAQFPQVILDMHHSSAYDSIEMPSQQACYGASMESVCELLATECCDEKIVCRCLRVTETQVVRMITQLELRTIRELKQITGAGDGCTCCHPQLAEYLQKHGCPAEMAVR